MESKDLDKKIEALEKYSSTFVYHRRLQLIGFGCRLFIAGVHYSIILPSGWKYLHGLGAETWLYGIAIGAFPATALLLSPVVGIIYDRTKRAKEIITVLNAFAAIGNIVYSLPYSPWLPALGRSLSGIGELGRTVAFGEIGWTIRKQDRVRAISYVLMPFMFGVLLGPPISLALKNVNFSLGKWHIDYRNAPGFLCIFLWLIMQVVTQFMISNIALDYVEPAFVEEVNAETSKLYQEDSLDGTELEDMPQKEIIADVSQHSKEDGKLGVERTWMTDLKNLLSFEVITIYFAKLVSCLLVYEGDTVVPLITQEDLKWSVASTSLVYACAGVCIALTYVVLGLIGKWISDIKAIMVMLILTTLSAILLLLYHFFSSSHIGSHVTFFVALGLMFIADPLDESFIASLLSKVVPPSLMGRAQSVGIMMSFLGNTVGPIVGSLYFKSMLVFGSLNIAICFLSLTCFSLATKRLSDRIIKYYN